VFRTPGAIAHYCLTASICRVGGRLPALEPPGTTLLCPTCSRPAKAVCWVCPVRSEVGQAAIPIAVRASGKCRISHRVVRMASRGAGGIRERLPEIRPPRSQCVSVCHCASVPRTSVPWSSSTDTDSERRRPTPGRWLNQSTALSGECSDLPVVATTPRPHPSRAMGALACGLYLLPAHVCPTCFPCPKPVKINRPPTNRWAEV
jgi:hypothetical protein